MAGINRYIPVMTLNVINSPNQKAQTSILAQKARKIYLLPSKNTPHHKRQKYFRVKTWKMYSSQKEPI